MARSVEHGQYQEKSALPLPSREVKMAKHCKEIEIYDTRGSINKLIPVPTSPKPSSDEGFTGPLPLQHFFHCDPS